MISRRSNSSAVPVSDDTCDDEGIGCDVEQLEGNTLSIAH